MPQGQGRRPLDQYEVNQMEESKRNAKDYNGNFTASVKNPNPNAKRLRDAGVPESRISKFDDMRHEEVEGLIAQAKASGDTARYQKARLARLKKAAAAADSDAKKIMSLKPGDTINSKSSGR